MTRNGPKIVTLKYGSNFIASDVESGLIFDMVAKLGKATRDFLIGEDLFL